MFWNYQQGRFNYPPDYGFYYAYNRYPPHQAFGPPILNAVPPPPHDLYVRHAYNGYPLHRVLLRPTVPTVVPPLPRTRDKNGKPPHNAPRPTIPAAIPPHQTPEPTIPAKVSPHKTLEPTIPAAIPPHQTPEPTIPAKVSPHKALEPTIPAATPPHQMPEPTIPTKVSSHKTLEPTIPDVVQAQQLPANLVCEVCDVPIPRKSLEDHKKGKRHRRKVQKQIDPLPRQKTSNGHDAKHIPAIVSPHKTLEPTIPDVVPIQQLPANLVCEVCDVPIPRECMEDHKKGKRHRRKVQEQIDHLPRQKTSNGPEAKDTPAIVLPHKTLEPSIPDAVSVQPLPENLVCEICDIPLSRKQLESHMKGKRHQRKVQEQIDHLPRQKTSNGHEAKHTPDIVSPHKMLEPTIPDVVPIQPLPENLVSGICDIPLSRKQLESHKNGKRHQRKVQEQIEYLRREKSSNGHEAKHTPTSQVSAVVQAKKVSKSKENRHEDNIGAEDWRFEVETVSPIYKSKNVPAVGFERKSLDNAGVKDCSLKRKIGEAKVAEGKYMKMNNEIRKPMKSSKPEVNALSNSVKSLVQAPELTPSSKGKEHQSMCFKVETVSPIFKNKTVPTEAPERKPLDNASAKDRGFKRDWRSQSRIR